jgi:hypothetical protein
MSAFPYKAGEYKPEGDFPALPAGKYKVQISSVVKKENSKNTGEGLEICFTVITGEYESRRIYEWLNLWHENQQARVIARNNLNGILASIFLQGIKDTDELLNKMLVVEAQVKKDQDGKERNRIKRYYNASEPLISDDEANNFVDEYDAAKTEDIPF